MPSTITTPAVQEISLGRIKPNPENPRKVITPEMVDTLAASLGAVGLKNPVKVVPLPDGDFELISGHIRLSAAQKLGWETIPAQVLNLSPGEAQDEAVLDNRGVQMHWLDWAIAIEKRLQADPKPTQQEVADIYGVSQAKVGGALGMVKCLTPASRDLIYHTVIKMGDLEAIPERPIMILTGLKDPLLVEKALRAAPPETLDIPKAKKLVEWVKAGNEPESFGQAPAKPHIQGSQGQPPKSTPTHSPSKGVPAVAGDNGGAQGDFMTHVGAMMAQHELTRKLHLPTGILNRMFPWVANLFHKTRGHVQGFGIKNQLFATFLTLLIFLFVGSTLIGWAKRATRWVVNAAVHLSTGPQASGQGLVVPSLGDDVNGGTKPGSAESPSNGPNGTAVSPSTDQPIAQNLASPKVSKGPQPKARVKSPAATIQAKAPAVSAANTGVIPNWAQDEIPVAGDFAGRFYGVSYSNWDDTLAYLKTKVLPGYAQVLVTQYFPSSLQMDMQKRQLTEYFSSSQPPRVVSGEGDSAEILVQGTATTQTRAGRMPKTISTKPVAMLVSFKHAESIGSKIEKVTEVDPATVTVKSQGSDLGQEIKGTVKDVGDAVNTAGNASDTAGKVKNLLGF